MTVAKLAHEAIQVSVAELLHEVDVVVVEHSVFEINDVWVVQFCEDGDFADSCRLDAIVLVVNMGLFDGVLLARLLVDALEYITVGPLAQLAHIDVLAKRVNCLHRIRLLLLLLLLLLVHHF